MPQHKSIYTQAVVWHTYGTHMHAASHGAPTLDVSAADCGGFASCWAHAWGVLPPVPGGIGGRWGKPERLGAPGVVLGLHTVVCDARGRF